MKKWTMMLALSVAMLTACGDDSDTQITELDDSDISSICEGETVAEVTCENGAELTTDSAAECEATLKSAPDSCTATRGDVEDCLAVAPCDRATSTDCGALFACLLGA